jgi:hypothetical protein
MIDQYQKLVNALSAADNAVEDAWYYLDMENSLSRLSLESKLYAYISALAQYETYCAVMMPGRYPRHSVSESEAEYTLWCFYHLCKVHDAPPVRFCTF